MITLSTYIKEGGVRDAYVRPEAIIAVSPTHPAMHGSLITLAGGSQMKVSQMPEDVIAAIKKADAKAKA